MADFAYKLLRFCPKSQLFVKFCAFEVAKNRFYDIRNKIQKIPSNIQSISFFAHLFLRFYLLLILQDLSSTKIAFGLAYHICA